MGTSGGPRVEDACQVRLNCPFAVYIFLLTGLPTEGLLFSESKAHFGQTLVFKNHFMFSSLI